MVYLKVYTGRPVSTLFSLKRLEIRSREENPEEQRMSGEPDGHDKNFVGPLEIGAKGINFDISNEKLCRFEHN